MPVETLPRASHGTHFDVEASPQCEAGHVVCVYVVHAEFATIVLYGTDVSQRHSVKPALIVLPSDLHVNSSFALRTMLPGGVVPP